MEDIKITADQLKPKITNEPEVVFNMISDKRVFGVKSEETGDSIFEITGYDLQIKFNRDVINTLEDTENLLEGIKDLFRQLIVADLLGGDSSDKNI